MKQYTNLSPVAFWRTLHIYFHLRAQTYIFSLSLTIFTVLNVIFQSFSLFYDTFADSWKPALMGNSSQWVYLFYYCTVMQLNTNASPDDGNITVAPPRCKTQQQFRNTIIILLLCFWNAVVFRTSGPPYKMHYMLRNLTSFRSSQGKC